MSEFKNAVVVGKVDLKPRQVVVATKGETQKRVIEGKIEIRERPARKDEQPRRAKRADDGRAAAAGNQMMLQELNYVKTQLRKVQDESTTHRTQAALFAAEVRALVAALDVPEGTTVEFADQLATVKKSLGL
jgi:hypothetical protein